jgi:ribosome-associated protein
MVLKARDFMAMGRLAARCAEDKKAEQISLLDMHRVSGVADYFLLATAESSPQLRAVQDAVEEALKRDYGLDPLHREGRDSRNWTVLDYGGLVVHLFHRNAREFYGIERLWENAKPLDWAAEEAPAAKKTAPRAGRPASRKAPAKPKASARKRGRSL